MDTKYAFKLIVPSVLLGMVLSVPSFAQDNMDWRYNGNTLDNERYQDVDQINPSTIPSTTFCAIAMFC